MLQQQSAASLQGADSIATYYHRAETHVWHMLVSNIDIIQWSGLVEQGSFYKQYQPDTRQVT